MCTLGVATITGAAVSVACTVGHRGNQRKRNDLSEREIGDKKEKKVSQKSVKRAKNEISRKSSRSKRSRRSVRSERNKRGQILEDDEVKEEKYNSERKSPRREEVEMSKMRADALRRMEPKPLVVSCSAEPFPKKCSFSVSQSACRPVLVQ